MLGKRQRVTLENSGNQTEKKIKFDNSQDSRFERESVSTNTQSKCITPTDGSIARAIPGVIEIIDTYTDKNKEDNAVL